MSPRVAVVVPCYNLGEYLDEAIESVLAQTFGDLEILIIDDGSEDERTRSILDTFTRPRTRVIRTENRGLSAARNTGIRHSAAPYVSCLDADDRLLPTMLERSVEVLDGRPDIHFVSHWLDTFGDEDWEWRPERCDFPTLLQTNPVNGAALMRRTLFDLVGGFDEDMREGCEDWDFWISAVERGCAGAIIPDVLYNYRRRADSMSRMMMHGERFARMYSFLAQKHAETFRRHLPSLVEHHEAEIAHFRHHVGALSADVRGWLDLEVQHQMDARATLTKKRERLIEREQAERERFESARVAKEFDLLTSEHVGLVDRHHQMMEDLTRARGEVEALRNSWSWRVAAPIRNIYRLLGFPRTRS